MIWDVHNAAQCSHKKGAVENKTSKPGGNYLWIEQMTGSQLIIKIIIKNF